MDARGKKSPHAAQQMQKADVKADAKSRPEFRAHDGAVQTGAKPGEQEIAQSREKAGFRSPAGR
jgi:hypothetical protein